MNNQSFAQKIKSNPKLNHFIAYCLTFLVYGAIITAIGPMIPYLADAQGVAQTQFSFLFFARAGAYFVTGFGLKLLENSFSLHYIIFVGCLGCGFFSTWFCFVDILFWRCVMMFLLSLFGAMVEICCNACILVAHSGNNPQFWMQINHGIFGIGGLIGPLIVYLYGAGICCAITAMSYLYLSSPQNDIQCDLSQVLSQSYNQYGNKLDYKQPKQNSKQKRFKQVPKFIEYLICLAFFIYIGMQTGFGGWISSYAVLQEVSTKQEATFYGTLFWISITVFRFIFAFITGKISTKIRISLYLSIIITALCSIFAFFQFYFLAIILSSVIFGIGMASLLPMFFAIPEQFQFQLKPSQTSNVCICFSLGEAVLSMFVGFLMGSFTNNMIFYSQLIFSVALLWVYSKIVYQFGLCSLKSTFNGQKNRTQQTILNKIEEKN